MLCKSRPSIKWGGLLGVQFGLENGLIIKAGDVVVNIIDRNAQSTKCNIFEKL